MMNIPLKSSYLWILLYSTTSTTAWVTTTTHRRVHAYHNPFRTSSDWVINRRRFSKLQAVNVGIARKDSIGEVLQDHSLAEPAALQLHENGQHFGNDDDKHDLTSVRAPIKYVGPYPCLSLKFPHLATRNQRSRNVTGISLDFVLDTAANVNTLNAAVAQELALPVVGKSLPGVGTAGSLPSAQTFLLGDAQLELVLSNRPEIWQNATFISGLTASALPIASPAAAGLLSLAFLQSFPGGVEFVWGTSEPPPLAEDNKPSITFYGRAEAIDDVDLNIRSVVTIQRIPVTNLPAVTVRINGVELPALLDTGSPITVLNVQAAQLAGIATVNIDSIQKASPGWNPLAAIGNRAAQAQAAARGDVLTIMGTAGKPIQLLKSQDVVSVTMPTQNPATGTAAASIHADRDDVEFGDGPVYVGELPGLAALQNLLPSATAPAVVLGMDVLRRRPRLWVRAQQNEIVF